MLKKEKTKIGASSKAHKVNQAKGKWEKNEKETKDFNLSSKKGKRL